MLVGCSNPDAELDALIDRYLLELWETNPEQASSAGLPGYYHRLSDLSQAGLAAEASGLRAILADLAAIDYERLGSDDHRVDYRLLGQHARVRLAEIERFPRAQREPGRYLPFGALNQLVGGDFAPAEQRAEWLLARLQTVPHIYEAGQANLDRPPRLFTEAALRSSRTHLRFLQEAVPGFAATVPSLEAALLDAAAAAEAALSAHISWMEETLLPRSDGELGAGREAYDFYLREIHGLDLNAEQVHALGWQIFNEVEAALAAQARVINPDKDWVEITEDIRNDHPERDDLLAAYCRGIQRSRAFVIERGLVTVPPNEEVRCIHSDPSQRAFSPFGTFRVPSPFTENKVGYIILHPVTEDRLLRAHDFTWIEVIAPHEAYPGHHLQALIAQQNPRPLRKIYRTPVFTEGWGLYTEQLMHEQGFFTKPEETRLTQLRLQLWRAARIILDSGLHTGLMSYDEARDFLAERVRMEYGATAGEVGIYIYRPSYVIGYMMGFREIMRLREDYMAMKGDDFDLLEFHDTMLGLGSIPFPMVRELLGLD